MKRHPKKRNRVSITMRRTAQDGDKHDYSVPPTGPGSRFCGHGRNRSFPSAFACSRLPGSAHQVRCSIQCGRQRRWRGPPAGRRHGASSGPARGGRQQGRCGRQPGCGSGRTRAGGRLHASGRFERASDRQSVRSGQAKLRSAERLCADRAGLRGAPRAAGQQGSARENAEGPDRFVQARGCQLRVLRVSAVPHTSPWNG